MSNYEIPKGDKMNLNKLVLFSLLMSFTAVPSANAQETGDGVELVVLGIAQAAGFP